MSSCLIYYQMFRNHGSGPSSGPNLPLQITALLAISRESLHRTISSLVNLPIIPILSHVMLDKNIIRARMSFPIPVPNKQTLQSALF